MRPCLYIRGATIHVMDILRMLGRRGKALGGDYLEGGEYLLYYRQGRERRWVRFNKEFDVLEEGTGEPELPGQSATA